MEGRDQVFKKKTKDYPNNPKDYPNNPEIEEQWKED